MLAIASLLHRSGAMNPSPPWPAEGTRTERNGDEDAARNGARLFREGGESSDERARISVIGRLAR